MTIKKVSFRDFLRGMVFGDILELVDKRTKKQKGLYISPKYAKEVLEFLKNKEDREKEAKKRALLDFIGAFGEGEEGAHSKIKAKKYE